MKKTFLVLLALTLLVTFASCRKTEEDEGSGFAENVDIEMLDGDSLNVTLTLPESWTESYSSYQGTEIRHYMSPLDSKADVFSESVSVTADILKDNMTLEDYANANIEAFKMTFTNFEMLSEAESVKLGELDGIRIVYSYTAGALSIVIDQTFVVADGKAYMIMCNATKDSYDGYADIFALARESFKIN